MLQVSAYVVLWYLRLYSYLRDVRRVQIHWKYRSQIPYEPETMKVMMSLIVAHLTAASVESPALRPRPRRKDHLRDRVPCRVRYPRAPTASSSQQQQRGHLQKASSRPSS